MRRLVLLALSLPLWSTAGEIALTFDDAPRADTAYFNGAQRTQKLIETLQAAHIPGTTFFVNAVRANAAGLARLRAYADAGFHLANHTFDHPDFNSTSLTDYIENFEKNDARVAPLPGFIKWFRFPFLREGNTVEKRDGFRDELAHRGYFNAYITVNNYDYYMDQLFQKAVREGRKVNQEALKKTYLEVLMNSVAYYDQMAQQVLGRSPKHVILLHENDLEALYAGELIRSLRTAGWKIITPEEAYQDPISTYQTARLLRYNPGRIAEIAKDRGWSGHLWHEACDEKFLENLFLSNGVYSSQGN